MVSLRLNINGALVKNLTHVVALVSLLFASSAHAFGKAQTPITLVTNPYVQTLLTAFNKAHKPTDYEPGVIDHGIVLNHQYNCRVFYALSESNSTTPITSAIWYNFERYGYLFLDNTASVEVGQIKTFAVNPTLSDELIGEADSHDYFEALRVNEAGDLLIEGSTPPQVWVSTVIDDLGLSSELPELASNTEGLALASQVVGLGNLVVSYAYCPYDPSGTAPFPKPSPSPSPSASPAHSSGH
jgi:hypothetical protein